MKRYLIKYYYKGYGQIEVEGENSQDAINNFYDGFGDETTQEDSIDEYIDIDYEEIKKKKIKKTRHNQRK